MEIFRVCGVYVGLYKQNIGTQKRSFATGRTMMDVIEKLLFNVQSLKED